jgi:Alginate lyase
MTLVSEDEAEPIHSAIIRKEAWTLDSVRRLRAEAERRLKEGPWSVTADRPKGIELDPHDFYSEDPYWWPDTEGGPYVLKDGQINPNRFQSNRLALVAMSDTVFTLGAAGFLLDEPRYAQRAARVIQTWFLNPRTRMNPSLEFARTIPGASGVRGAGILDGRAFIRAIQGMEFLEQTGVWDAKEQAATRKWFADYLHWLTQSKNGSEEKKSGNHHAAWWTAQVAAVASFTGNNAAMQSAFNYYRDRILPRQIRPDGSAPKEEARTRSLSLSVFNLEAYTVICRIGQVQGVDLWPARGKNGADLRTVITYLKPYVADPHKWSKEQNAEFPADGIYSLAFAGMGLKDPDYVALYRKLERPDGAWLSFVDLLVGRWEASAHQTRH